MDKQKNLIIISGPTGVGKTNIGIELAQILETEIISADSRQIFKELRIGTAVPSQEQLSLVKHHFIQTQSIHDYYNASMYEFAAIDVLNDLFKKHNNVLMVGGSGLYIDAVCYGIDDLPTIDTELRNNLMLRLSKEGLESLRFELKQIDPDYYEQADLQNPKRILKALEVFYMTGKKYSSFLTKSKKNRNFNIVRLGLNRDRDELHTIINLRVDLMVEEGLVKEAENVYQYKNLNSLNTVGYRELFDYFDNKHDLQTAIELIKRNTRRYARKQISWFNRESDIRWFNPAKKTEIINFVKQKFI